MPGKYKLFYFNATGRAEVARLLFAQAGVEYEDCRITGEEFSAMKDDSEKCPLGQLPVLVIDGDKRLPQSNAIARHLARTFGLYGKTVEEAVLIDVVMETAVDLLNPLIKAVKEKDQAKKAEMTKEYIEKGSVPYLTALCRQLDKNSEGKGYLVGDSMTLADIVIFDLVDSFFRRLNAYEALVSKYPRLTEFSDRMKAEPKIAAWIEKRPDTN